MVEGAYALTSKLATKLCQPQWCCIAVTDAIPTRDGIESTETHMLPTVFCNCARTTQWERHFKQKMLRRLDVYIQKNEVRFPLFTIHMELSHKGFEPIKLLEDILGDLSMTLTLGMARHEGRSTTQGKHIKLHLTKERRKSTIKSKIQPHRIG